MNQEPTMHPIQDQNLTPAQVTQLTRAMLSVALVDGIHPAEAALIGQFYESSRRADMPTTAAVLATPDSETFDGSSLAGSTPEFADTVVLMCLMAGYADGNLSEAESTHVKAIATAMNVDAAHFDTLLAQVRDELVGAISHLPDSGSVATVVKEMAQSD
jgi:glutathione S-transferase